MGRDGNQKHLWRDRPLWQDRPRRWSHTNWASVMEHWWCPPQISFRQFSRRHFPKEGRLTELSVLYCCHGSDLSHLRSAFMWDVPRFSCPVISSLAARAECSVLWSVSRRTGGKNCQAIYGTHVKPNQCLMSNTRSLRRNILKQTKVNRLGRAGTRPESGSRKVLCCFCQLLLEAAFLNVELPLKAGNGSNWRCGLQCCEPIIPR